MDEKYISRTEHEEFVERIKSEHRRLEEEDNRQNRRLEELEKKTEEITNLSLSIHDLSFSVKTISKENERLCQTLEVSIKEISDRLAKFESQDGEKWRKMLWYIGTTVVGITIGFLLKQIGL